jgi:hypothetical protein
MATSELLVTYGATPATPASGKTKVYVTSGKQLACVDDAGTIHLEFDNQNPMIVVAGTASQAPLTLTSGTLETSPSGGEQEYDGTALYSTNDSTNGRRVNDTWNYFRLAANGSGITTIADFFGTNDGIPTVLNGVYDIEWHCYWVHTTTGTGTITWTIVNTQTVTNMVAEYMQCPIGGIGTVGTPQTAGVIAQTAASVALPVTGVNTAVANHYAKIHATFEAATSGNVRLRMTASAGTATPSRDSFFRVRRLPAGNVGTYVA